MKKMYSLTEISEKLNIPYIKVYKRAVSKYANQRWGVEVTELPDSRRRYFVPEDKIYIWVDNPEYEKPTKEELKELG
jgi:hypothetical protein